MMNLNARRFSLANISLATFVVVASSALCASAVDPARPKRSNGEPGWAGGVVLFGQERDAVKSMPITQRPYRPLHFYGNTVRRMHYRGTAIPAPRDIVGAGAATITGN